jgi:hypothetical protein
VAHHHLPNQRVTGHRIVSFTIQTMCRASLIGSTLFGEALGVVSILGAAAIAGGVLAIALDKNSKESPAPALQLKARSTFSRRSDGQALAHSVHELADAEVGARPC